MGVVTNLASLSAPMSRLLELVRPRTERDAALEALARLNGANHWDRLLELAGLHGVTSALTRNLRELDWNSVPADVRGRLHEGLLANSVSQLHAQGWLLRVARRFEASGVDCIPFKGPLLNAILYGSEPIREFSDLDILVRPEGVASAKRLLSELGYQASVDVSDPVRHPTLRSYRKLDFRGEARPPIELHWHLNLFPHPELVDMEKIWMRCDWVALEGTSVRSLGQDDLLLYLCFHGWKHHWSSLSLVLDLAMLMEREQELDWTSITGQAARKRAQRILLIGLWLANELLGARVSIDLSGWKREDPKLESLFQESTEYLLNDQVMSGVRLTKYFLRGLETTTDRLGFLLGLARPTEYDWECHRFPDQLSFLYYLSRLVRLCREVLGQKRFA